MTTTEKLSQKIKLLREASNYTQQYVADVLQVSPATYSLIEQGVGKGLSLERLEKLSSLYNMSLTDLINLSDQNIFHSITNSATHNVSDNITINNGLKEEEIAMYKSIIERLEKQNDKLMALIDKLSEKL